MLTGLLGLVLSGCPLFDPAAFLQSPQSSQSSGGSAGGGGGAGSAEAVTTTAAQITLAWDPPATGGSVDSYTLSYRAHGTSSWTALGTVTASATPTYTVLHSAVGGRRVRFRRVCR